MAKLVFAMNQSLDGYVDHTAFAPSPTLFRHFIEEVQGQAGSVYGRQMYEVMRYWDDDHPEWDAEEHAFAAAWRKQPKWVVSRSLKSVGPNATLVEKDLEGAIRELNANHERAEFSFTTTLFSGACSGRHAGLGVPPPPSSCAWRLTSSRRGMSSRPCLGS